MKKVGIIFLAILFAALFSNLVQFSSAALPTDTLTDNVGKLNDNLNNIPTNPEDARQIIRDRYLKQEWNNILINNTYIGPFHRAFMSNQWLFQILFHESYSFSLTFLITLVLWFSSLFIVRIGFKPFFKLPYWSWIYGVLISMGLAWTNVFKGIMAGLLNIIYGQDAWWARLIMWLIFGMILFIIFYLDKIFAKNVMKTKLAKEKALMKQDIAENKAFIKGQKEILKD
jgi:hypothetical protein